MKKILITGASGFIGSFLVEEALRLGWDVWAGIRKNSSREYLQDQSLRFIDLNYSDKEKLRQQIEEHVAQFGKWDYIIHNAGVTKCLNIHDFEKVNYLFSRHFVETLQETDAVPEKFILMSSLSAFPNPDTAYGQSKLKAEQFIETQGDFPYLILRPTGVYGPRDRDYYLVFKTIKSGLDVAVGFEVQKLTFLYVKDLVRAVYLALESPFTHKAYFVTDGDVYSNQEFTQIVKEALGKKWALKIRIPLCVLKGVAVLSEVFSRWTKQPSALNRDKYKIMKQRDWTCDILPLQQDLGFTASYDLRRGVEETINRYRENKWL